MCFSDIAVQRQSAIIALRVNLSLVFDGARGAYLIYHKADAALKGKGQSIRVLLPPEWTPYFNFWLNTARPVLMEAHHQQHDFVFLTRAAKPRSTLGNLMDKLRERYDREKEKRRGELEGGRKTDAVRRAGISSRATTSGLRSRQVLLRENML